MEDKKFDDVLRRLSLEAEPSDVPDVWGDIEKRLNRRHRVILWRRIAISSSVAAVLALALFLPQGKNAETVSVVEPEHFYEAASVVGNLMDEEVPSPVIQQIQTHSDDAVGGVESVETVEAAKDTETVESVVTVESVETVEAAKDTETVKNTETVEVAEIAETFDSQNLLAFSAEESEDVRDISISVSSDFYTIYGTGNVNFVSRSMSGGTDGSDISNVKPLAGSSPNHSIPLSAGVELQYGFGKKNSLGQHRMGIGIGVDYTYMRSSYQALVSKTYLGKYGAGNEQASVTQGLQYIGIPFSLYMNILTGDKLFFYASVGGEVEKGLQLKY
ncbi:MAG: hypothetical protein KBS57_06090, partial [Alistipes sp.]|nr:hypothetical protein [Candidatus Minthomonas equi]